MKKIIFIAVIFFTAIPGVNAATRETYDFSNLKVMLAHSWTKVNSYGTPTKDTYVELQGIHRYGPLDLYWFIDFSDVFRSPEWSDSFYNDYYYVYGEITPRLSLDWISNKDLSFLCFKEWFLVYRFDFDTANGKPEWGGEERGLIKHYIGMGTDLNIPIFDYFKVDILARYIQKNYGRSEGMFDGGMLNIVYALTIYQFKNGIKLGYSSWMKYVFAARHEEQNQTHDSFQWNNSFGISWKGIMLSYSYQVNTNYLEVNQYSSGVHNQSVGISYSFTF